MKVWPANILANQKQAGANQMNKVWLITRFTLPVYAEMYPTDEDMEQLTYDRLDSNLYEDLQLYKSLVDAGLNCQIVPIATIKNYTKITEFPNLALVRFNAWEESDNEVLQFLEYNGVSLINNVKSHMLCIDKWTQWMALNEAGIRVPKTKFINSHEYQTKLNEFSIMSEIENEIKFPLIAKPSNGSRGQNVHLCKDINELKVACDLIKSSGHKRIIIQEWINPKNTGVISVFTIGGNAIVAQQRRPISTDSVFISNFRDNSIRNNYSITDDLKKICHDTCRILNGIDMSRIDILHDGNEYVICEVNSPGSFVSFDIANKTKYAKQIVDYINSL